MIDVPRWLAELREELHRANPPKHQHIIDDNRFVNVLAGTLSDGTTGSKVIWYDERTGRAKSTITICRPDGVMATIEGTEITAIRCGLLAVLALDQALGLEPGTSPLVGIRGYGRLGTAIAKVIKAVREDTIIPIYSPRQTPASDQPDLANLDALITATSLRDDPPLAYNPRAATRAYIAFDSNLSLGPTYREAIASYSDHPTQLLSHWSDEFPNETPPDIRPMFAPIEGPAAFYLFGVAVADLIVARGLLWGS